VLGAYTTAWARLKLLETIEMAGRDCLYYDTDSIIYISRPGSVDIPNGAYLGELTDELAEYGPGSFITRFSSGGPKNYGYRVAICGDRENTVDVCKVRGLTLCHKALQTVNYNVIERLTVEGGDPVAVVTDSKIVRIKHFKIASRRESKLYRVVYTKRRKTDNHDTLPYGFKSV
jgi:hypothetical protein